MAPQVQSQKSDEGFCDGVVDSEAPGTRLWSWLGILTPMLIFWASCLRYLSPLPVTDDYDAVLFYLVHLHELPTRAAKVGILFFHQHNEYKPIWANLLIALQYKLSGRVNFIALSLLGDLQVMLLAWLLWKSFAPASVTRTYRLTLFVPVALIVFQTNYAETLNWPMPGIQNVGVVTFALLSVWLLSRAGHGNFAGACAGFALAISASGNGFFLYPVGLFLLWQQRQMLRMLLWTLVAAACASVYFMHYTRGPRLPRAPVPGLHPIFILSFLGSFGGVTLPVLRYGSVLCGAAMAVCIFFAVKHRYDQRNRAVVGFALFLLISALAVSVSRGGLGYVQSLSGRYKLYSDMLLVCAYAFGLDVITKLPLEQQRVAFRRVVVAAVFFFLVGTAYGVRTLHTRYLALNQGMALYKMSHGTQGPVPLPANATSEELETIVSLNQHFREALDKAAVDGIYRVP